MPRAPKCDIRQLATGSAVELIWSDDETVVQFAFYSKEGKKSSMRLTAVELDEIRRFLIDRMI